MQILQQQYPKFKTYKYQVFYTDFQPNATRYGTLLIKTLAKTVDIAFIKVWHNQKFVAPSLSTCTLRIHDNLSLPASDNAQGQYTTWNGLMNATPYTGVIQSSVSRSITTTSPASTVISSMVAPTGIYATINLNNPRNINQLTAGSFYIWIGTYMNK